MRRLSIRLLSTLVMLGLALVPLTSACAQPPEGNACDDFADLADAWDEMAGTVDEQGGADEAMQAALGELFDGTLEMAKVLIESGTPEQVAAGNDLATAIAAARRTKSVDGLVNGMDAVVANLDDLVDLCDRDMEAANAESPAGGPADSAPAGGAIRVYYEPPQDPSQQPFAALAASSGVFEGIAGMVDSTLVLPADLDTVFTSCGEPNAFFDPENGRVVMCYEFMALFAQLFADTAASGEELDDAVLDVAAFFYLHEIGHALVSYLDLPVTGREEDSVDGLATLVLLQAGVEGAVLTAIDNFAAMSSLMPSDGELPFWDEHSLDAQRLYDVACLVYGSDPEAFADMVGPDLLPAERAERCPQEYEQKDRAWDTLLGPYYAEDAD